MIIFDIETDGLLEEVTKIHCLVMQDTRTGVVWKFFGDNLKEGIQILKESPQIGGHNVISFDIPVLEKLYGFHYEGEVFDTLVASRLIWSNLKEKDLIKRSVDNRLIGSHSLKAWGQRLCYHKGDYGDTNNAWDSFSIEMLEYCVQDVALNVKLYELIGRKNYPQEPMELEHEMAKMLFKQQMVGFPFDVESAQKLFSRLSARKQEIESTLVDTLEPTIVELKTKTKIIPFNPASRQQIADRLMKKGWTPKDFTPSGDPKVDEKILAGIDMPEARLLTEFLMLNKRLGQLGNGKQAWLKLGRSYSW